MINLNQDEIQLFLTLLESTQVQCHEDALIKMLELIVKLKEAMEEETDGE